MKVMKTPKSVEITITNRCNLRCLYCSHFSSASECEDELETDEWLSFFKELGQNAVLSVSIGGGEPFIREDLPQIIDGIAKNKMRFDIASNGTLINDGIAAHIASSKRCNHVQVSIDGSNPEAHDSCRGRGNFEKAVNGIHILKKHKIPVTVRLTIHHYNVNDLDNIAYFLLEELELPGFTTNAASYMGLFRKNADRLALSVEERTMAMAKLLELKKKYNGRISAQAGPLAEAETWLEMEKAKNEKQDAMSSCGYLTSCGGIFSKLAVRPDGTITPCNQMHHIELGRINKDALKKIWQSHPEVERLRNRRQISLKKFEFCNGCGYIKYCRGGCPAIAYNITGSDANPSPDICLKRFLDQGGKLPND